MKILTIRIQAFRGSLGRVAAIALLAALFAVAPFHTAIAQVAPPMGTTQSFAVLGGTTVTNTGPSVITGDLGLSPGSAVTGFPPGTVVGGTLHKTDALALQAQSDTTIAYNNLAGQAPTKGLTGQDLGGMTLVKGVFSFSSSAQLTGALTLDGQGDPASVWVFQIGSTLTTASAASVVLINGASPCNVYWQVGSSATIGTTTSFVGNIFALTSITLTTNASLAGRALARNGAVTMDSNTVSIAACGGTTGTPVPPTLSKAFSPATINAGGTSTLTITLNNPNTKAAGLSAPLTDMLPSGVVVSGAASTTCGGTVTAIAGSSAVTLTGGTIPLNGSCVLVVDVAAASGGTYINSLASGALVTSNGTNAAPAVATLTVNSSGAVTPTLGKAFNPATINAGGNSILTITLTNPNTTAASLSAPLTDTLPSGLVVSGSASTTCVGGTASTGTSTATAQVRAAVTPLWFGSASTVTLTGGTIPAKGSCVLTVGVVAASGGSYTNTLAAGDLVTSNGNNTAPAVATLTANSPVVATPTLGKAFTPATVNAGKASTLTITLTNPNSTAASLNAPLTDTLPNGLVVSGSASTTCVGGTASTGGPAVSSQVRAAVTPLWYGTASTVTLTGGTIPANGSCVLAVDVVAASGGSYINTLAAGDLVTSNGNNTAAAVATLTVSTPSPVTLGKAFSPATINAGGVSVLTITLSNAGATPASLTAPLTDTLPSGTVVSGSAGSTCGGTLTAVGGASTVSLTGGSIPAGSSCMVTVSITAPVAGSYFNSLAAGAVQTNQGSNAAPAVATLTVNPVITNVGISVGMVTPGTVQITRGVPVTVMLDVVTNPPNMLIPTDVSFACAVPDALVATTCSLSPTVITAGSSSGSATIMTINTTRGTTGSNLLHFNPGPPPPWYRMWALSATLLALTGLLGFAGNLSSRRRLRYLTVVLLALTVCGLAGCGGSTLGTTSPSASGSAGSASFAGTSTGPSSITVTATADGVVKTMSIPINVN
jgi:uncharacterized repeat protein (TIGR01451 family)